MGKPRKLWDVCLLIWSNVDWLVRRRQWHPTPVLLPGKSHGRRSLVGWSPWGRKESDMTEWLHFHFSLLCFGEGNDKPLQCSCLENPRNGAAQSRTRLKWLSSSSSRLAGHMVLTVKARWELVWGHTSFLFNWHLFEGFSWWRMCLQLGRPGFSPWVGKISWRREWKPTPLFLPGESHRLQSMGSQWVGHNWVINTFTFLFEKTLCAWNCAGLVHKCWLISGTPQLRKIDNTLLQSCFAGNESET